MGGPVGDVIHSYCECARIAFLWCWIRETSLRVLGIRNISNRELLYLLHPPGRAAATITWLVTSYIEFVWLEGKRGTRMSTGNLKSFLSGRIGRVKDGKAGHNVFAWVLNT